jgi:hypothetical protein
MMSMEQTPERPGLDPSLSLNNHHYLIRPTLTRSIQTKPITNPPEQLRYLNQIGLSPDSQLTMFHQFLQMGKEAL